MTEGLELMEPAADWEPSSVQASIDLLRRHRDELVVRVWCGDWCNDCRAVLPSFAAGLAAAGIEPETVHQYPVEKTDDGSKRGPLVGEYGVTVIPTIVLERDGEELVRFEESADQPAVAVLADALDTPEQRPDAS